MTDHDAELVAASRFWAQTPEQRRQLALISWMEHEHVKRYINRRTTGADADDWFSYVLRRYCDPPLERAFSLGCGTGGLERNALASGGVQVVDACDASEGAIETALASAAEAELSTRVVYRVADMNVLDLGDTRYDAIFASMSVHHARELEHIFAEMQRALKPGGLVIMNEYIGATRFRVPQVQLNLINDVLRILPARLRRIISNGTMTDVIKERYETLTEEWFLQNDPSEAIRSAEIMPLLRESFDIIEFKPYGGSLLHFLLENIVGNFDESREEDRAWLEMVEYVELTVERAGLLASDFALIVARKRPELAAS